ncbi:hypothetical protein LguiA_010827 [Lonicera macranthoides]
MEWYFANDDDLVVPKDQEQLDRLPSPDSWSQWGVAKFERPDSPRKPFNGGRNSYDEVDNRSLQWAALSREQHEHQLNDIAGINQMDDIFLSSLLEEDNSSTDHLHGSSSYSAKSNYSMLSADNYLSEFMPSHTYSMGSSRYLKTHDFSPSVEWNNADIATSCPQVKVARGSVPSGQDGVSRYMEEETSPEESVLQELERVTSQLTEQTRTCFRDALYRLAENSKQQKVNSTQNGDHFADEDDLMVVDDETFRLGKTEATESKTNVIDRTIANLMFNKMEHFSSEDCSAGSSFNLDLHLSGDAEVPISNQDNYLNRDFSAFNNNNVLSFC